MVVYHFNLEDHSLRKMKVIKITPGNRYDLIRVFINPETDCRADKYKKWINVCKEEGVVHYNSFQLAEEDDVRAQKIFEDYRIELLKKKEKQFNKAKEKWGF